MAKKNEPMTRGLTQYRVAEGAGWVEVDGQRVPDRFYAETTVDFDGEDGGDGLFRPYERVTYVVEDGQVIVDEYAIKRWQGLSLNDTRLRDRGLEAMGVRALDRLARGTGGAIEHGFGLATDAERAARRAAVESMVSKPGRPAVSDAEVREAADVYREAESAGRSPAAACAEILGLTRTQVQLRLKRAREAGYLPPYARGGKR